MDVEWCLACDRLRGSAVDAGEIVIACRPRHAFAEDATPFAAIR
jgi:hypothetical protein